MQTRRQFIHRSALASAAASILPGTKAAEKGPAAGGAFQIGVTDWNLGKRHDVAAIPLAASLGIAGVQVSFGKPGEPNDLRDPKNLEAYTAACSESGTGVASLAMGVLNGVPYKSAPETEEWVSASIDAAKAVRDRGLWKTASGKTGQIDASGRAIVLLAFFGKGDLLDDPDGTDEVIRRFKKIAPKAEDAGIILGIESWLDVDSHLRILDAVDSPAVQVYYDCGNMKKRDYDIYAEIRKLGRERICQIHAKDDAGRLFGHGEVDFWKVKAACDEIGYRDWIVIEGKTPFGLTDSYKHDARYLASVFS